jgi:hypothetical protein
LGAPPLLRTAIEQSMSVKCARLMAKPAGRTGLPLAGKTPDSALKLHRDCSGECRISLEAAIQVTCSWSHGSWGPIGRHGGSRERECSEHGSRERRTPHTSLLSRAARYRAGPANSYDARA